MGREGRGGYHCLSYFRVCGDTAVVLFRDLGFSLAEIFAGGVEGGFGHGRSSGILGGLLSTGFRLVVIWVNGIVNDSLGELLILEGLKSFRSCDR